MSSGNKVQLNDVYENTIAIAKDEKDDDDNDDGNARRRGRRIGRLCQHYAARYIP